MKILVIQIKMIGDVLASSVLFEAIKKVHPNWEIHYLIQKNTIPVVENNPFIDKIVLFEEEKYVGFGGIVQLGKELRAEKYDTIIDVYGKFNSLLPTFLSGAKNRIGTYKWYSKLFKSCCGFAVGHVLLLCIYFFIYFNFHFQFLYAIVFFSKLFF